jgi:hypothetical protein
MEAVGRTGQWAGSPWRVRRLVGQATGTIDLVGVIQRGATLGPEGRRKDLDRRVSASDHSATVGTTVRYWAATREPGRGRECHPGDSG